MLTEAQCKEVVQKKGLKSCRDLEYNWLGTDDQGRDVVARLIYGFRISVLFGLTLTIGGGQLIMLGGSAYYLIVGLLMIVSGGLLALLKPLGAWLYVAVFIGTVVWALGEVGLNGWALVPRVIAPLVLLILVVLSFPALKREGGGGKLAFGGCCLLCVVRYLRKRGG